MRKSKLYEILSNFSGHDFNRAAKYVASPFYNDDKDVVDLFDYFFTQHKSHLPFADKKVNVFDAVFRKAKYDDKRFRYVVSGLTRLLEDFLVLKDLQKDNREWLIRKQKVMLEHNCYKAFHFVTNELEACLKSGWQDAAVHLYHHENEIARLEYTAMNQKRKVPLPFDKVMDDLDKFYLARKLRLSAEIINAQNILAGEHTIRLLSEVRKLSDESDFHDVPAIRMYMSVLNTLLEPEKQEHFEEFRKLMSDYGNCFSNKEKRGLFHYLKNYCIKKINTGQTEFLEKLFEIYKLNLADTHLFRDEALSPWEYKNIVSIGLRLGNLDWVHDFILKFNRYLENSQQENARVYNLGNWNFHCGHYHETMRLFQQVEFTDLYYQLDVRAILLKSYYELGEEETLYYYASAFRTFLSRNRLISPYQKKIYRNLIGYTVKLQRVGYDAVKVQALLDEIRRVKSTADFTWLEKKILELIDVPSKSA